MKESPPLIPPQGVKPNLTSTKGFHFYFLRTKNTQFYILHSTFFILNSSFNLRWTQKDYTRQSNRINRTRLTCARTVGSCVGSNHCILSGDIC